MSIPSKDWKEEISPDEEERYQEYSKKIIEVQKRKSKVYGNGRALHRKQICALNAKLKVLENIPDYAKQGLFANPTEHEVIIRISNGGVDVKPDFIPDVRGFAFKVFGVNGPSALGNGNTQTQDFTLINMPAFAFPKSEQFIDLVVASSKSPVSILTYLIKSHGIFGGIQKVIQTAKTFGKPFTSFFTENFYSAAPICCGEYAARVRLIPKLDKQNRKFTNSDFSLDIKKILSEEDVSFDLQLQFFVDEKTTPIEDASLDWEESKSPYTSVATLVIPKQDLDSEEGKNLAEKAEKMYFDPWNALLAHKPLGDIMRARKYVYYESQKERGANQ